MFGELFWTEFWFPYNRWFTFILFAFFIWNIYNLYRFLGDYSFTKKKIKEIKKTFDNSISSKTLNYLEKKEYSKNLKYYIIENILSKYLKSELEKKKNNKLFTIY